MADENAGRRMIKPIGKPISKPILVVLGGINMDVVANVQRMPEAGETVHGDSFFMTGGGKGANQAVAASRLGAEVRMVGRVGDDDFGRALLDALRSEGIDVSGVAPDPSNGTGVAVIMVDASGQNCIAEIYGANRASDETQLEAAKRAMEGADALMLQLETPPEVSLEAARHARSMGVRVIWDPAPAAEMPSEGLTIADFLTPNETEAEALTGIRVTDEESAREAAEALIAKGVDAAVITLGERGVYAIAGNEHYLVSPFEVDVVDSVAAGDAFAAGLAVAISEGFGFEDALKFGAASGGLAVTNPGARDAMPFRGEVEAMLSDEG